MSRSLRLVFLDPGATGSDALARFLEERDGVVMASGVSTSEASCASVAGARRTRVLPLRPEGGMVDDEVGVRMRETLVCRVCLG